MNAELVTDLKTLLDKVGQICRQAEKALEKAEEDGPEASVEPLTRELETYESLEEILQEALDLLQ